MAFYGLGLVVLCSFTCVLSFSAGVSSNSFSVGKSTSNSVLQSVLKDLDMSVDPCANFYQFTCGRYIQNQTLPTGFASKLGDLQGKVIDIIRDSLEEPIDYETELSPLIKAKTLYKSCLGEHMIEKTGGKRILSFIQYIGGWPILGRRHLRKFDFEGMLAKAAPLFGVPGLSFLTGGAIIGVNILQDYKQNGRYLVYFDQPQLGQRGFAGLTNFELYSLGRNSLYAKAYIQFGKEIMTTLGSTVSSASKDMNDIYTFETEMARLFLGEQVRRRVSERYQKLTVFQLSLMYPYFNWLRFLQLIGATRGAGIYFGLKDHVVLWAKPYYDRLFPVLKKTSTRVIANYIKFRTILSLMPTLGEKFQAINNRYEATINGANELSLPPRRNFCARVAIEKMQWITSRLLVERKLTKSVLAKAIKIKNYVRDAFRKDIATANWIDGYTRQNALRKFDQIDDNFGFPDYLLDDNFLNFFYKWHNVKGENFFDDFLEVNIGNYVTNLHQLIKPQLDRWILTPVVPNAAHERGRNSITLTAAVLDEPLIKSDYPPAMIFGALGYLTAHEFQHAFDSAGIHFNEKGMIRTGVWSTSSVKKFNRKAMCFIQQYSNYFLTDVNIPVTNGIKTLDENLCDNVGITTAYRAYQNWKSDTGYDDSVLPFSGDELFFINFGRHMCARWSPEFIFKFPLIDHHSLFRLRVIGSLQNSPEFAQTFKCPVGSFMNPVKKCSFW